MPSPQHPSELSSAPWAQCQRIVRRFEQAWQQGAPPTIEAFLPPDGPLRQTVLRELIQTDIEFRRNACETVSLLDYLIRFPGLADDRATLLELYRVECARCGNLPTVASVRRTDAPDRREEKTTAPPLRLGKYELRAEVGRGSSGVVYRAQDTELDRPVAVKLFRADRLGSSAQPGPERERFLREARSAAQLRHPHIVEVHDAGQVGDDCFLVSAFVEGPTLAERLRVWKQTPGATRPSWRQIAELTQRLAEALHHAHQQGIVHRDLKPANILLARDAEESGGELRMPYLTDFGLAKRLDHEPTLTAAGEVLGTPAYMSPEQAHGEAHRVDGRSDVYSLGVILYQLLTGELPFQGSSARVLQQVLTEEPRPPCTLNEAIPRDLETICLKAMSKEPAGRYRNAADLAEDLGRYLRGEPVRARPLGRLRRLTRWARRKPVLAALTAGLTLSVLSGLVLVSWQWWRAETHLAEARQRQEEADRAFRQAFQTVQDLSQVCKDPQMQRWSLSPLRRQLLSKCLDYYQAFVRERGNDPTLRKELAQAYLALGSIPEGLDEPAAVMAAFRQACALAEELRREAPADPQVRQLLAEAYCALAGQHWHQGEAADSLQAAEQARALLEGLLQERPHDVELQVRLAEVWYSVGLVHLGSGQNTQARSALQRARALYRPLVAARPEADSWQYRLGGICQRLGELEQDSSLALEAFAAYQHACSTREKMAALGQAGSETPEYYLDLAKLLHKLEQPAQALLVLEQGCRLAADIAALPESGPRAQNMLARSWYELGRLRNKKGQRPAALESFRQAQKVWQELSEAHPSEAEYRRLLGVCLHEVGRLEHDAGRLSEAAAAFQQAQGLRAKLQQDQPEFVQYRLDLSATAVHLGRVLEQLQRPAEALSAYRQALAQQRVVWEQGSKEPWQRKWLKERYECVTGLLRRLGRTEEAAVLERERQTLIPTTPGGGILSGLGSLLGPGAKSKQP